jgi:hypothetical protein
MPTNRQLTANRANATRSTGPQTEEGKARASKNSLRHGLRSEAPVVPGEAAEAWQAHLAGIRRDLAPAGALEQSLADRVALCLWRLQRVARFETAVTGVGLDEIEEEVRSPEQRGSYSWDKTDQGRLEKTAEELRQEREVIETWEGTLRLLQRLPRLADDEQVSGDDAYGAFHDLWAALPDDADAPDFEEYGEFLAGLGVPRDERDAPYDWEGWTAGTVRRGADQFAREGEADPDKLLAKATRSREDLQAEKKAEARRLEGQVKALRKRIRVREERLRQRRMLPEAKVLETIARYEGHLSRQMLQALHTLERLRADRKGEPVPLPAALDVTVNGELPAPAAEVLEDAGSR